MGARGWGRAVLATAGLLVTALAGAGAGTAAGAGAAAAQEATAAPASAPAPSAGCGTTTVAPGTATVATTSGGTARTYRRHVPAAHDGTTPLPLLVAVHGYTEGADIHALTTQYEALADAEGFVVAFPQGLGSPAAWNPTPGSADVAFLGDLLDELEATLCVDTNRVHMSGYSMGAFMTSTVACVYADRVASVAPVAGIRNPAGCAPARPMPILTFHGTADPLVGFGAVPATVAAWAERNGCDPEPTTTPVGGDDVVTIAHVAYTCPDDGAPVHFVRIDGGGHGWPGSAFSRSLADTPIADLIGYTTLEISATELIWAFFQTTPMPVHEEPPPTSGTFRALTYNVAGLPEPLSGSEPATNSPYIGPLLNDYDLVLLQENWGSNPPPPIPGVEHYHEILVAEAEHPYRSTPAANPWGTHPARASAILADGLNRLSRFPFGEITRVMWPDCFGGADTSDGGAADCLAIKGFSMARTELAPGVEVDVYNLHAEAGNTPADLTARAEDYEVLAAFMAEHSAGRPIIVGGDFNLHTDRTVDGGIHREFLRATGLTDVCQVVDCGADLHQIDKFAFRGGNGIVLEALTHRFERDRFVRPTDGARLSDHNPLAVTFAWSLQPDAPGTIRGTVTTEDGTPLEGAFVGAFLTADGFAPTAAVFTGPDGTYALPAPAGDYQVMFAAPDAGVTHEWSGDTPDRRAATLVTVTAAGVAPAVDAALAGAGAIEGTLTGPGGPVAGATVSAFLPGDVYVGSQQRTTADDGSFSLPGTAPGTYRVLFNPPKGSGLAARWYDGATTRAAATPVEVALGATVTIAGTVPAG